MNTLPILAPFTDSRARLAESRATGEASEQDVGSMGPQASPQRASARRHLYSKAGAA